MENENDTKSDLAIDGGELTAEEQKAADALAKEGSGDDTDAGGADDATAVAAKAAEDEVARKAAEDTVAADAAATADAYRAASEAAARAKAAVAPDPKPDAGRDFDADRAAIVAKRSEINDKYKAGTLDEDERDSAMQVVQDELDKLNEARSEYRTRVAVWEDRQQRTAAAAAAEFNSTALAWEKANADFMANPLRRDAMQKAIAAIDKETPGLSAQELLDEAEKVAFEAFNYKRTPAADAAAALARAVSARKTDTSKIPPTARSAPAAGGLDPGKSSFSQLDEMDISDLEDAVARFGRDKVDEYLRDAPGADSRGQ